MLVGGRRTAPQTIPHGFAGGPVPPVLFFRGVVASWLGWPAPRGRDDNRSVLTSAGIGFALVLAIVAQIVGFAGPAQAANTLAGEIASVAHSPFKVNSKGAKEALVASLKPVATAVPGPARIDAVAGTVAGYADGVRYREDFNGQQAYLEDLHLVSHLDTAVGKATDAAATELLSSALTELLLAGRLTSETAVADARTALSPATSSDPLVDLQSREAAEREIASAERALAQAREALAKGLAVPAETHFGTAWRHGTNALADLGITYDGDRDGDGIPDRAELAVGASPLLKDTDGDGLRDASSSTPWPCWH